MRSLGGDAPFDDAGREEKAIHQLAMLQFIESLRQLIWFEGHAAGFGCARRERGNNNTSRSQAVVSIVFITGIGPFGVTTLAIQAWHILAP